MMQKQQSKEVKKFSPKGNLDICNFDNGAFFIVGWAVFSTDSSKPSRLFFCPEGLPRVEVYVTPQKRKDVQEYLKISADFSFGFSTLQLLSNFDMERLPSGKVSVVVTDFSGEKSLDLGTINIVWPEPTLSVLPAGQKEEMLQQEQIGKPKFFKKMWGGEFGSDIELQPLLNTHMPLAAKALLDAHAFILKRSTAISMTDRSLPIRVAAGLAQTSQNEGLMLIFDHNFGGGANAYSKQIVDGHLKGGNEVLRVWYEPNKLMFSATYYKAGENIDIKIKNLNQVFEICTTFKPQVTLVNSLWTYINLPLVLDNLIRMKLYGYTQRLEVFAHDHMGICPSLFLLDENFKYCGVPEDIKKCNGCLKKNIQEFDIFFSNIDILEWRKNWESFFRNCDTIRFFSQSTKSHYLRAYPWLDETNAAIVEGHVVGGFFERQVDLRVLESDNFRIGIFGFIGAHKGSDVVKAIASRIDELGDKASVYVFGSLDGISTGSTDSLKIMGNYDRSDLVALCEDNKIDIAFVPSICPETYSFITKELMLIGMPVATFDLGGQKELVTTYDKGHVLKLADKSPVYDRLKRIFNATYKK